MDSTSNSNSIELIAPDDWHIHLRDGDALRLTVLHAVRKIGGERQQLTELNQQLHVLEQTLKG